jgi:hypothetical protein
MHATSSPRVGKAVLRVESKTIAIEMGTYATYQVETVEVAPILY